MTPLSYAWLWILVLISCAVYAADAFTAVNLLAFNKWSSQVQPKVPFEVAKWIFAITIIISYVFLAYRFLRAFRVMRSGSVTECYLEPMAAIWQSMRLTSSGRGWRRFLVFAELTKSKKGANYIALFVYFQFKSALIIIVAQGPRIAINAMTLYAVMQAQLLPVGEHASEDRSSFEQFFMNIKAMIETGNKQETIVYFTMLFSLVIWVIAALGIIISCVLYVFFLWHYIPRADGSLTNYCRRKVETRLARIVGKKMKKAIEKEDQKRRAEEQKAIKKGTLNSVSSKKPTLPSLAGKEDDDLSIYGVQRSDTFSTIATLPPYSSNAPSRSNTVVTNNSVGFGRKPTLPTLNERPGPERSNTNFSTTSYGSNAPLLNQASDMGMASPLPPVPHLDQNAYFYEDPPLAPPARAFTPMSQGRASPRPTLPQVDTNYSNDRYSPSHDLVSPLADTYGAQPAQSYNAFSPYNNRGPATGPEYELSPVDITPQDNGPRHYHSNSNGSNEYRPPQLPGALRAGSPAMSQTSNLPPRAGTAPPPRAGTAPPRPGLPASLQSAIQRREASQPLPNRSMTSSVPAVQQRSATAPVQQPGWNAPAQRSYTPSSLAERNYTPAQRGRTPTEMNYTPAERSYTPANNNYPSSSQRGYDNSYGS